MELNLEHTRDFPLGPALVDELLAAQHECTMTWSTRDGWPMAMVQVFLWCDGRIWTTTSSHKQRVLALRARPLSCIVVSGEGTKLGGDRSVAIKTRVTVHDDRVTKDWFLPAMARKMAGGDGPAAEQLQALLDSPRRVVLEHEPVKLLGYDGHAMRDALLAEVRSRS